MTQIMQLGKFFFLHTVYETLASCDIMSLFYTTIIAEDFLIALFSNNVLFFLYCVDFFIMLHLLTTSDFFSFR